MLNKTPVIQGKTLCRHKLMNLCSLQPLSCLINTMFNMTRIWTFTSIKLHIADLHIQYVSHQTLLGFNGIQRSVMRSVMARITVLTLQCITLVSARVHTFMKKSFSETINFACFALNTAASKIPLNTQISLLPHNISVSLTKLDASRFLEGLNLLTENKM